MANVLESNFHNDIQGSVVLLKDLKGFIKIRGFYSNEDRIKILKEFNHFVLSNKNQNIKYQALVLNGIKPVDLILL